MLLSPQTRHFSKSLFGRFPASGISFAIFIWLVVLIFLPSANLCGQINDKPPAEISKVKVTQNVDAQIPLDMEFIDSRGERLTLGKIFNGRVPILLTMNYSDCPMLCSLQLNTLLDAIKKMPWDLGKEYEIVTVCIDPLETPERSELTKQKYLRLYGRAGCEKGWHFLTTSKEASIKKLAETVGFGYTYVPETRQYAHPTPLMICTPSGKVSRYLDMKQYDPQTIRFSLLEASEGKIGTATDQFFLSCFHYDAEKGRYAPAAMRLMQIGAGLTVLVVGGFLISRWIREARKGKSPQFQGTH